MSATHPDLIDSTLETIAEVTASDRQRSPEDVQRDIRRGLNRLRRPQNIVEAIELSIQANPLQAMAITFLLGAMVARR